MCTVEKRGNVFILTLTGDDDHKLNPTLITSIRSALAHIKFQATTSTSSATALVMTATGKFFSNGLDLRWAQSCGPASFSGRFHNLVDILKPLVADLMSLPMPTIAAVCGHAVGAGFVVALSHDYVFMQKGKGVLYMSELDMGSKMDMLGTMTIPEYFWAAFREKLRSPATRREVMLRGARLKAEKAVELGIVDSAHDSGEEVVEAAVRLGEELVKRKWNGEVYCEIRKSLYPGLCKEVGLTRRVVVAPRL